MTIDISDCGTFVNMEFETYLIDDRDNDIRLIGGKKIVFCVARIDDEVYMPIPNPMRVDGNIRLEKIVMCPSLTLHNLRPDKVYYVDDGSKFIELGTKKDIIKGVTAL